MYRRRVCELATHGSKLFENAYECSDDCCVVVAASRAESAQNTDGFQIESMSVLLCTARRVLF